MFKFAGFHSEILYVFTHLQFVAAVLVKKQKEFPKLGVGPGYCWFWSFLCEGK